jgi:ribosome recycling factor
MDKKELLQDMEDRMSKAVQLADQELKGLRTGRASAHLLDPVMVEAYGTKLPINQVATVTTQDPKTLLVQVWDKNMVKAVEKAIADANLGLTPAPDGQTIRIPIPLLSQERRQELVKVAHQYAENARVSVRNVRRDVKDRLKKANKASELSEDDWHKALEEVQKLTDKYIGNIDEKLKAKENDILNT